MEDGLFPGYMSIMSDDPEELEEERRLCYVAITRAMKHLTISYAKRRMVRGDSVQYYFKICKRDSNEPCKQQKCNG